MNLLKLSLKYFMSDKNFERYDEKIENFCELSLERYDDYSCHCVSKKQRKKKKKK